MKAPRFWQSRGLLSALLLPEAALFAIISRLSTQSGKAEKMERPVLCVGNLVAGGAGKTPTVLALAALLQAAGKTPFALSRGYGGSEAGPLRVDVPRHDAAQVGDEALLLAEKLPTVIAIDRVAGAREAIRQGADILLMDDGFQNPMLFKDRHILVIDGAYGFGNGRVVPAGPLREPIASGLARADAIVLIGEVTAPGLAEILRGFAHPVFRASLQPRDSERLRGMRLLAFAGIGRPEKFFAMLAQCGASIVRQMSFADHHPYRPREIEALVREAAKTGAELVTTRKDYVRLSPSQRQQVRVLDVQLRFENEMQISGWLANV